MFEDKDSRLKDFADLWIETPQCTLTPLLPLLLHELKEFRSSQRGFIIGMFHDLCKCDQYKKVQGIMADLGNGDQIMMSPESFHYEYNTNILLKGHGDKSVMILSQFITLTEEEMLCIRYHMGAYEKDDWQFFDAAIRKTNGLALYTHTADMLASKVDNI